MKKHKTRNRIILLLVMLLFIGLGYALLTQDLTIYGTTKIRENSWDIHFNNVQVNSNSVALSTGDSTAAISQSNNTLVEYTITLNAPGDFYEFTVDAVNAGTIDGMIGSITSKLNGTEISSTNPLPNYINYSVTYADETELSSNQILAAGTTETYRVRIEFKRDIENTELPSSLQTKTFSFGINYIQSDSNAQKVREIYYMGGRIYTTLGYPWDSSILHYSTPEEAMQQMMSEFGTNKFYIKGIVKNEIISDAYLIYNITNEMAQANSNLTPGTYEFRGGGATFNGTYYNSDSIYFNDNVALANTIFGESNCSLNSSQYVCYTAGLHIILDKNGSVISYDEINGLPSCGVQIWSSHPREYKINCLFADG